jgi:hypothetical protein
MEVLSKVDGDVMSAGIKCPSDYKLQYSSYHFSCVLESNTPTSLEGVKVVWEYASTVYGNSPRNFIALEE